MCWSWNTTTLNVVVLIMWSWVYLIVSYCIKAVVGIVDLCGRHHQVGSLAGAAHLLNDNAGVLRWAQWEQKSHVDPKGESLLDFHFNMNTNCENMAYRSFRSEKCSARGVRKVTTGITGLWQPSVHSDVAFWFFDVGSYYHCLAAEAKCRIVHPPTGNVSWV